MPSKHTPENCGCEWGHGKMCSLHESAPDLLEALRNILHYPMATTNREPLIQMLTEIADIARAAIAKAEGE